MLRFALAIAVLCTGLFSSTAEAQVLKKIVSPVKKAAQCIGGACRQQQQAQPAGVVVGQVEPDGAIVTSVGPYPDPVPSQPSVASASPTPAPAVPEQSIIQGRSRADFRQVLLKAARSERGQSLSVADYFTLFRGSLDPKKVEEARLTILDSAVQDGVISEGEAIGALDWSQLFELIIKYLPLLLELFRK